MVKLEEIKKKLNELDNEEKLNYLEELLDEIEDEGLIEEIENLIKNLKDNLENRLNVEIPLARKVIREIDFDEAESDVENINRSVSKSFQRPDLVLREKEDEEKFKGYQAKNNYSNFSIYEQEIFSYDKFQRMDVESVKQNLIRENILNPGGNITDFERENLNKKLREAMPGMSEEKLFEYQARIIDDLKKDEKMKYITRLK